MTFLPARTLVGLRQANFRRAAYRRGHNPPLLWRRPVGLRDGAGLRAQIEAVESEPNFTHPELLRSRDLRLPKGRSLCHTHPWRDAMATPYLGERLFAGSKPPVRGRQANPERGRSKANGVANSQRRGGKALTRSGKSRKRTPVANSAVSRANTSLANRKQRQPPGEHLPPTGKPRLTHNAR